jgi:DNA repair exonuclease SbcCD ATPase subunit
MITFKQITWKNFLSTGNNPTTINLTENTTNLIVGSNGAGKSTILDALTFALFNKPFRKINKPQLVNSQNDRDCVVEIDFEVGSVCWKVVRGMKPNIFEIHKNGKKLPQSADIKDDQKLLEQSILKLNYKSFTQIVVLGSTNFVPFMQLTAANRREVIEDLLDIKIFSSMNDIVKMDLKDNRDEIKTLELNLESVKDKIEMQQSFIKQLEDRGKQDITERKNKIKELESLILESQNSINELTEQIDSVNTEIVSFSDSTEKLKKLGTLKGKMSQKINNIIKEHKFFNENTVCPTCTQDIDEQFRLNKITDAQTNAKELQEGFKNLESAISEEEFRENRFLELTKRVSTLTNEISKHTTKVSENGKQIQQLRQEIQKVADSLKNKNIEHDKLEQYRQEHQSFKTKLNERKEKSSYYDFIYLLLKDGGVKTQIIKHYLPLINKKVNEYLHQLDFYINFNLDEEFNERIKTPIHDTFSYTSFSEGEKMRIDLALLFTWREVARLKNSINTNLLIMDEVFDSSLDSFGTDEFLKIIRYIIKDANIFVISHKSELHDKFESVIRFEKVKNFSRIV